MKIYQDKNLKYVCIAVLVMGWSLMQVEVGWSLMQVVGWSLMEVMRWSLMEVMGWSLMQMEVVVSLSVGEDKDRSESSASDMLVFSLRESL